MHVSSFLRMKWFKNDFLNSFQSEKLKILDIGSCDVNGSYKPLFQEENWEYFGLDIQKGSNVDIIVKDIYNWIEISSEDFDVIISGQAFEHIDFFWLTMSEIQRVLKVGGLCCIIAPSSGSEHKYPVDCYRFYEDGMKALANYVGFEILHVSSAKEKDNLSFEDNECEWKDSILVAKKISDRSCAVNEKIQLLETIQKQKEIIACYENSEFWKMTKPIRVIIDLLKKINP